MLNKIHTQAKMLRLLMLSTLALANISLSAQTTTKEETIISKNCQSANYTVW